jgi:hypothetical protein
MGGTSSLRVIALGKIWFSNVGLSYPDTFSNGMEIDRDFFAFLYR